MAIEVYVLIEAGIGKTAEVVEALAKLDGVKSARSVTGPYDVIVAVEAADLDRLGSLMSDVHSIPGIEKTTTCIGVTLRKKKEEAALPWETLRAELLKRKAANEPVKTLARGYAHWINEVGDDYVVLRSERTGRGRRITSSAIESSSAPSRIVAALRRLGGYL